MFKYYSLSQTKQRLSTIIAPLTLDERAILDLIRIQELSPYMWYDGYVGVPRESKIEILRDCTIELVDRVQGYLKLDYEKHLSDIGGLLLDGCEKIFVTEILEFSDLEKGYTAAPAFDVSGILFSKNIVADKRVTLPIKVCDLSVFFLTPGVQVYKHDIYFLAEDIERFAYEYPQLEKKRIANFLTNNVDKEIKNYLNQDDISSNCLSVLDKDHEDFAPNIVVGIELNQFISKRRSAFIETCQKSNDSSQFNREECADEFFDMHGIMGIKERERLKVISNTLMSGKSSPELQKLAKNIKLF